MTPELEKAIAKFMQSYIEMQEENSDMKEAAEHSEKVITQKNKSIEKQANIINRLESEKEDLHCKLDNANDQIALLQSENEELREKVNAKPLKWGDPAKWKDKTWYIRFIKSCEPELWRHVQPDDHSKIMYLSDILALIDDSEATQ